MTEAERLARLICEELGKNPDEMLEPDLGSASQVFYALKPSTRSSLWRWSAWPALASMVGLHRLADRLIERKARALAAAREGRE